LSRSTDSQSEKLSDEAREDALARLKTEFLALKTGFKDKTYAGTPIYDQLKREYDESAALDEQIALITSRTSQKLFYGTFI
jgi:hypothetical protein